MSAYVPSFFSVLSTSKAPSRIGLDGVPQYKAGIAGQGRPEPRRCSPATDRVPFHAQPPFCSCQRRSIFSKRCVFIDSLSTQLLITLLNLGELIASAGDGTHIPSSSKKRDFLRLFGFHV